MAQLLPTPVTSKSSSLSNKRKATAQAGGTASKKQKKPQCPICGKFHHGQCRFAKTTTKSKDTSFKGKTKHFKSEFLKLMKQMTEDSDDESSGYSTDTSWKKNTTQEERVFIMGATTDASDSETSIDPSTAKQLLKKFRKKKKQFTKSNKTY